MSQTPVPSTLDRSLVERIRLGDAGAFDTMFRALYGSLCTFAFGYVRSREDAEDVVQDVFAAVWRRRSEWRPEGDLKAYMFGAVRNRSLRRSEQMAAQSKRGTVLPFDLASVNAGSSAAPDRQAESEDVERNVRDAIAALPERSREVVRLRWQHEMTYSEIASVMGISVKGVENQLARATKKLRERLTWLREAQIS